MKAFLEIYRKNFFIGFEKGDFSKLENFENFKLNLYILNSKVKNHENASYYKNV
jgi:hypothetical protein